MIRTFQENDLNSVMQIWLDTNIKAHSFIPTEYWIGHYATVIQMLPQAEVYVYEEEDTHQVLGFIGLIDHYIAGIFVDDTVQSKGIGKQLLDHAKEMKSTLHLNVYQKNTQAISFYQREQFVIQSESVDDSTNEKEFLMAFD